MFGSLNEKIQEVKEKQRLKRKWEHKLERFTEEKNLAQSKADELKELLEKEKVDVEKLESISLTNFLSTITGTKDEKLENERQEVQAAKLKYSEAVEAVIDLKVEQDHCKERLEEIGDPSDKYEALLKEKERLIKAQDSPLSEKLYELLDREADLQELLKEIVEANEAGFETKEPLEIALQSLEKAKNWGTWDMLGGGTISTYVKHNHIDDAKSNIHLAQHKLKNFQAELTDLGHYSTATIEISGLLTFADYFFDGIIADWMVQDKINNSYNEVRKQLDEVNDILIDLEQEKQITEQKLKCTEQEKIAIISHA